MNVKDDLRAAVASRLPMADVFWEPKGDPLGLGPDVLTAAGRGLSSNWTESRVKALK